MKNHQKNQNLVNPVVKLLNVRLQLLNLVSYFMFFTCFLCFAVVLFFYGHSLSLNLQFAGHFTVVSNSNVSADNNVINNTETSAAAAAGNETVVVVPKQTAPRLFVEDDKELLRMASRTPRREVGDGAATKPKVAFMFLTKGPVLLGPLWERFFRKYEGLFSIYVHSDPSFNGSEPESSVFHGRRIPSKEVGWGKVSMIEAERRLLANALLDSLNERFVLLSESCIPLFNFSTIYSYLMNSSTTFVESYDQPGGVGRGRYSNRMSPQITLDKWRKGSQWFQIDRDLAMEVVRDQKYFPIFLKYCNGQCYSDEHYLPTFLNINTKFGKRNLNRTLTWVDWSKQGPHPSSFMRQHVTPEFLERLRSVSTCKYNGETTNVCHLFARKFTTHSLDRLLRFAPKIMQFDA